MIVLPAMSPLLAPGGAELRAEEWLDLTGLFDPVALAALGGALLLVVVLTVLVGWLAWRRVRRTALAGRGGELTAFGREVGARGRELGVQSAAALAALRLPPGGRRTTAELHLQLSRARSRLRRQLTAARAGGAHLGDVPALMPTLEAEGNRLEGRLRQWALAPAIESAGPAGPVELEAEVRAHLVMLTEVSEAVLHAAAPAASSRQLAADVDDAVSGLRAHAAAYRELTNPLAPPLLPGLPVHRATEETKRQ